MTMENTNEIFKEEDSFQEHHADLKWPDANRHCSDSSGSEIVDEDWRKAFAEYETACGGFGEHRTIMMQAFAYGWDMRTHKHSFQNKLL